MAAPASSAMKRIVLTGGPCSGKTSVLAAVSGALESNGVKAYCAPEVPSIIQLGGAKYPGLQNPKQLHAFESALLDLQQQVERSFEKIAAASDTASVLLCDRGLLDISAYIPGELWDSLLAERGMDNAAALASYDAIIHLVTAADGAEEFYTTANNGARTETAEQARQLDALVHRAWSAHPAHVTIDNSGEGGFPEKQQRVVDAVLKACGL